jgi:hypothetical protein
VQGTSFLFIFPDKEGLSLHFTHLLTWFYEQIYRESPSRWRFLAVGEGASGQIYKHLIPQVVSHQRTSFFFALALIFSCSSFRISSSLHLPSSNYHIQQKPWLDKEPSKWKLAVIVHEARNLTGGNSSNSYAEARFDTDSQKTKVVKHTQNPDWHDHSFSLSGSANCFEVNIFDHHTFKKDKVKQPSSFPVSSPLSLCNYHFHLPFSFFFVFFTFLLSDSFLL